MNEQLGRKAIPRLSILLAAVLLLGTIGGVWAWNMHKANQPNVLQSRNTSVRIDEEFPIKSYKPGDVAKVLTKKVKFTNTGSSPVFLRVAYVESWTEGNGEWWEDASGGFTPDWTTAWTNEWVDGGDGWYYYKKVLPKDGSTAEVLKSLTLGPGGIMNGYHRCQYHLEFLVETVQLSDEAAVNTSASQVVFGKTATVGSMTTSNGMVTSGTVSWS